MCLRTRLPLTRLQYSTVRLPTWSRELPHELIQRLITMGVRSRTITFGFARHPFDPQDHPNQLNGNAPRLHDDWLPGPLVPRARHDGAPLHLGPNVSHPNVRSMSAADFQKSKVFVNSFVVTRAAPRCELSTENPFLNDLPYWVFQVRCYYPPGSPLPANSRKVGSLGEDTYECQLYSPEDGKMTPCWEAERRPQFLWAEDEKNNKPWALFKEKRLHDALGHRCAATETIRVPIVAFLRPANLIGGGFSLTSNQRVPQYVVRHVERVLDV